MLFQLLFDTNQTPIASSGGGVSGIAIAFVVVVMAVFAVGIVLIRRAMTSSASNWEEAERKRFQKAWDELTQLAKVGGAPGRKLAMIEADKLVDTVLRKVGFPGETMAERLKVAEYQHPAIKNMWTAHRWRNQLVHEAHFTLTDRQTQEALKAFEAVLRSFKAL